MNKAYTSRTKYTKEALTEAVQNSKSVAGVLRYFDLKQTGGSYSHIGRKIKDFGIDTSHFGGQKQGLAPGINKVHHTELLVLGDRLNRRVSGKRLTRALIESGRLHQCEICGILPIWQDRALVLQVDHINGQHWDNREENLRFLCPNCHSQTETYGRVSQRQRK